MVTPWRTRRAALCRRVRAWVWWHAHAVAIGRDELVVAVLLVLAAAAVMGSCIVAREAPRGCPPPEPGRTLVWHQSAEGVATCRYH